MIRRSLVFSFADKYANVVLGLATMAIVSRLLTPAEVGLFLVASAAVILFEAFRDFGVGACIIQERELTPAFVRTAFTVMALLSAALGLTLFLAAGPVAHFYGEPGLERLVRIATLGFVSAPFSSPLLALMRRDMAFGAVACISVTASVVTAGATIALALLGFGAASFVWASVAAAAVTTAGAFIARPALWAFRPTLVEWRSVVPFGAWSSIVTLLGLLYDFMPRLVLGRTIGVDAVGLFGRAVSLCQLPERACLSAVQPVILPALSARVRAGGDVAQPYLLGLANITGFQWPALVCLALLADPIVRVMLGGQWHEVVPLVRIVALATLAVFPVYLTYPVLVALGRLKDMVLVSLLTLPPSILILLGASRFGLEAAALSLLVTGPLQSLVALTVIRRHLRFGWGELARSMVPSAVVTAFTAVLPACVIAWSQGGLALTVPEAALAGAGAALGWLAGLRLARHPLEPEVRRAGLALRRVLQRPRVRLP